MMERLNGIYACAIYDTRDDSLLVVRDGLGVKPLYYAETSQGVVFASELKALLQDPSIDRALDAETVRHHLLYLWSPSPLTMLKAVHKLEPGCAMRIRQGRIQRKWTFYDLPFDQEFVDWPTGDAIIQVRKYLTLAVERQLVSDVPVGAFLSGGLDSSSVVALAQRAMGNERLQCFTIGFNDPRAIAEGMAEDLPHAQPRGQASRRRSPCHGDSRPRDGRRTPVTWSSTWTSRRRIRRRSMPSSSAGSPGSTASRSCSRAPVATTCSPAIAATTALNLEYLLVVAARARHAAGLQQPPTAHTCVPPARLRRRISKAFRYARPRRRRAHRLLLPLDRRRSSWSHVF